MKENIVSEESVEKALDWLRDNADEIGEAKRQAVKAEHMVKHTRAVAMKISEQPSIGAQERDALASGQYLNAIEVAAEAAGKFETMKALREAAALRFEVWRSSSANYRSMKL